MHDGDEAAPIDLQGDGLSGKSKSHIVHLDASRKEQFLHLIKSYANAHHGRATRRIEFALGTGVGCVRNWILLLNVGRRFISIDDDHVYRFRQFCPPMARPNSVRSVGYSDALDSLEERSIPYTGEPAQELLQALDCSTATGGPVFAAMAGVFGGRWFSRPHGVLQASDDLHRFSYGRRRKYVRMKENPVGSLQATEVMTSNSGFFMTGCCSIDARQLLPPFPPITRTEDTFWATLATSLVPGSGVAYLPFSIYHDPENKRPFTEDEYRTVSPDFGLINLLILRDLSYQRPPCAGPAGYETIGQRFLEIAALNDEEWREYLKELWLEHIRQAIGDAETKLRRCQAKPRWWAEDVHRFIEDAREQATAPPPADTKRHHRSYLRWYAELLNDWPVIWAAAQELNRNEAGLVL